MTWVNLESEAGACIRRGFVSRERGRRLGLAFSGDETSASRWRRCRRRQCGRRKTGSTPSLNAILSWPRPCRMTSLTQQRGSGSCGRRQDPRSPSRLDDAGRPTLPGPESAFSSWPLRAGRFRRHVPRRETAAWSRARRSRPGRGLRSVRSRRPGVPAASFSGSQAQPVPSSLGEGTRRTDAVGPVRGQPGGLPGGLSTLPRSAGPSRSVDRKVGLY